MFVSRFRFSTITHSNRCGNFAFLTVRCFGEKSTISSNKILPQNVKRRRLGLLRKLEANNDELCSLFSPLRQCVKEKEILVNNLRASNCAKSDLESAVNELKSARKRLEAQESALVTRENFRKLLIGDLLRRRYFISGSFEIYGGVSRCFDFGPLGVQLMDNLIDCWKQHFVRHDRLLQLKCSTLTPEVVFKASGHLQRFTDVSVKDKVTGETFRLDHLIRNFLNDQLRSETITEALKTEYENTLKKLNELSVQELDSVSKKYSLKSPLGNDLSDAVEKNLMFKTNAQLGNDTSMYLRPELSQSAFINFHKLLDFNKGRLPFGVSQIGTAFRNELTSSGSFTRMREFTLAEIQYFFDPHMKSNVNFDSVKNIEVRLYSACNQNSDTNAETMTVEQAVRSGLFSENIGYFIARIQLFLVKIGIDDKRLRFRQHNDKELAHYAVSCWDAECFTYGGWLECVGIADRACNDIEKHSKASNVHLDFKKPLDVPVFKNVFEVKYVSDVDIRVKSYISRLNNEEIEAIANDIRSKGHHFIVVDGDSFCLTESMLNINENISKTNVEEVLPHVVEPSFGIERLMYSVIDHNFSIRKDDERKAYFSLPCSIAPIKCCVLPLGSNEDFKPLAREIYDHLNSEGIVCTLDDTRNSIGLRYLKSDEMGIPFACTVDFDSLSKPHSVTIRDRDTLKQIRVPVDNLAEVLKNLCSQAVTFEDVQTMFPLFTGQITTTNSASVKCN